VAKDDHEKDHEATAAIATNGEILQLRLSEAEWYACKETRYKCKGYDEAKEAQRTWW